MAKSSAPGETLKGHAGPGALDRQGLTDIVVLALRQASGSDDGRPLLAEALRRAGSTDLPAAAGPLTAFVLGPLHQAVCAARDEDVADRLVRILKPVLQRRSQLELGKPPDASPQQKAVLVVDDDIVVRAQVTSILGAAGYQVVSAPDMNVALAMSVRCRPDLVISNPAMGQLRGNQLTALLRVAFREDAPPIIILSEDERWRQQALGVCVVPKPVDRDRLLAAVSELLRPSSAAHTR
jgi:CheY-like chemotaxis protein